MNTPLISLIVPIYNVEKYLLDCLKSIAQQSYTNIEVILVDDGSTDSSGQIAETFAKEDSRFRVIYQPNQGVSSARNTGIEYSQGDYLCFADSDDILESDYIQYLYNLIYTTGADISLTTCMFSSYGDKQVKNDHTTVVSGEESAIAIMHYFIPIGCYCKLISRAIIDTPIRFIPEVYIGEGFNFNVDAFMHATKVAIGNRKIYKYRRDNDQSAMTLFKAHKCSMALKAIDIIRKKLPNKPEFEESYKYAMWHTASNMYDWIMLSNAMKDYPNLYDECKKWVKGYSRIALRTKAKRSDKLRAILQSIHPSIVPNLIKLRRKIYL